MNTTSSNPISVVADRDKFAMQLGIPSSRVQEMAIPVVGGILIATTIGLAHYLALVANLGFLTKMAVAAGVLAAPSPAAPIVIAVLSGLVGTSVIYSIRKLQALHKTPKSYNSALDHLGAVIAPYLFWTAATLAMPDDKIAPKERSFIRREMRKWGYQQKWINQFISDAEGLGREAIIADLTASSGSLKKIIHKITNGDCSSQQIKVLAKSITKQVWAITGYCPDAKADNYKRIEPLL
jgi:hypothetical protein